MYIPIRPGDVVKRGDGSRAVVIDHYVPDDPAETQGHNMFVVESSDGVRATVFEEELTLVQLAGGESDDRAALFEKEKRKESEDRINRLVRLRQQRERVGDGEEALPGFSGSPVSFEGITAYIKFLKENEAQQAALIRQMTPEEMEEADRRYSEWFRAYLAG